MEQVHLNRKDGIAKVLGTVSSVAGSRDYPLQGTNPFWIKFTVTPIIFLTFFRKCRGEELEFRLHLSYWSLPLLV